MGMLGSVILILLGALAAGELLTARYKQLRMPLTAITPLSGLLGVGAALNGLFCVIKMLAYLGFIGVAPTVYLVNIAAGALSLSLGVRFGYSTLMVWLGGKLSPARRAACDRLYGRLCAQDTAHGVLGVALGLFAALFNLIT